MTPLEVPLDQNKLYPDELTDGCNGECVGFTFSDIIGNIIGNPCDLQFTYAAGLDISGLEPTTLGEDPYAGAASGVIFGALPVSGETPATEAMPQLSAVNFANYTAAQQALAAKSVQNGLIPLPDYTSIANYVLQYQKGAGICVNWYESFNTNVSNGILPMPQPGEQPISKHEIACYGSTAAGLIIKSWQGPTIPYLILPLPVFNVCFINAYGYDPTAWRWLSLVKLALYYPSWSTAQVISQVFPKLGTTQ